MRFILICAAFFWLQVNCVAQHENSLPDSTIAAFSALDYPSFRARFADSGLSRFFKHPEIRNFIQPTDERELSSKRGPIWVALQEDLLRQFAKGQITLAVLENSPSYSRCLIFDCESPDSAAACVKRLVQPESGSKATAAIRQVNSTVFVCDSDAALPSLIRPDRSLAKNDGFTNTVKASSGRLTTADFWFYCDLWAWIVPDRNKISKTMKVAMNEGLDSIRTLGGYGQLDSETQTTAFAGEIFANQPFKRGLRLADLQNTKRSSLPSWTNSGTSAGFLNLKMDQFLTAFSTVFEAIAADGDEGVFEAVLDDLKTESNGPKIDVDKEIIRNLGSPASFFSDEIGGRSVTLVGVPLKNREAVVDAFTRFYKGDQSAKLLESKLVAWRVEPIESIKTDSSKPYVLAISDEFLFIAPDLSLAETAAQSKSQFVELVANGAAQNLLTEFSFGYTLNVLKNANIRYQKLLSGKTDGLVDAIFDRSNLTAQQQSKRIKALPPFSDVAKYFSSRLKILGKSTRTGWSISGSISK